MTLSQVISGGDGRILKTKDAEAVIEDIAILNGVFTPTLLKRAESDRDIRRLVASNTHLKIIASKATERLAQDLNNSPTHFVLECIQNADDNHYAAGFKPFLRLSVCPQRIQVDCNEDGFKEADVRAICNVGGSQKSKQKTIDGHVGYIGEKGIGFKSVFKVAEKVYIHSPPFSFMFDKQRELGMITPLWVPEEEVRSTIRDDTQTAITLLPSAEANFETLLKDFISIPSTLLLFLRKLKVLELVVTGLPSKAGPTSVHKSLTSMTLENERVTILTERDMISSKIMKEDKYHIFKQVRQVSTNVKEPRRDGVQRTELVLAFPMDSGSPCSSTQPVHAFLPIRDYGFRFLIQADFILTSNRQDVELKYAWNIALRDCVAQVFKDAILQFVNSPNHELRYTWMRFLPDNISDNFWGPIKDSIEKVMQSSMVLESRAGTLHCPTNLVRLGSDIKDRYECPIVGADSKYLSSKYAYVDVCLLEILGCKICSWHWVLGQLYLLGDTVTSKPEYWHEDLAESLQNISGTVAWVDWSLRIKKLPLIPLHSGTAKERTWISAADIATHPIYFRKGNGIADVPTDINLRLVDSNSSMNNHREQFFRLLGVKNCNKREVANEILRKHQDGKPPPRMNDAIAHVNYLSTLDSTILNELALENLWLYDEQGSPARGYELYIRPIEPKKYTAASLFESKFPARFLSASYGECTESSNECKISPSMQSWLVQRTGITDIPRLKTAGKLSPEFKFLFDKFPNDVLHVLKEHWTIYESFVESIKAIKDEMSSYEVRTFDGVEFKQQKLKDTFAPEPLLKRVSDELCSKSKGVFFLHLESYESCDWAFLKIFGVRFAADLNFYDWMVEQPQFRDLCTPSKFGGLLSRMAILAGVDSVQQSKVRMTFTKNNVFIPKDLSPLWVRRSDCVWRAPPTFQRQHSIKQWYSDNEIIMNLLRSTLEIKDATAEAVIEDLKSKSPSDEYLRDASSYLVSKLKDNMNSSAIDKVKEAFKNHDFLQIGGASPRRVKSSSCFWGFPKFEGPMLNFKHDLQREYNNDTIMKTLCLSILSIQGPSWDDVISQLIQLKLQDGVAEDVKKIYAYIFCAFSKTEQVWELMRKQFESRELVFVELPGGNGWTRPSECVWETPISLRSKFALKEQYGSSEILVRNLLQSALKIKNTGVREYISELQLLSKTGSCNREEVENLYKHIELQWNPKEESCKNFESASGLIFNCRVGKWVSLKDCIWYGPDCIKHTTKLASLYPGSKRLFNEYLQVKDATLTTFNREFLGLRIPDAENLSVESLKRVKSLLFGVNKLIESSKQEFPKSLEKLMRNSRIWPQRYIGSASITLVDLTQPFFLPDHPRLLKLLELKEECHFPILEMDFEECRKIKQLQIALDIEGRSLSSSKKETVSATDTSDPADDLTEDLRKRAQALYYCAVHYETKHRPLDDLLKKLSEICVYRTPDISTRYEIDSQGIKKIVIATGYLRIAVEKEELRVFVPDDESLQKTGYSNNLAREMIKNLEIPEDKAWQAVSALLTSEPDVEQLALILSLHGIHHKLNLPSISQPGYTDKRANSPSFHKDEDAERSSAITDLPTDGEDTIRLGALKSGLNTSLPIRGRGGPRHIHENSNSDVRENSKDSTSFNTEATKTPPLSDTVASETSSNSDELSNHSFAALTDRLIAEARASNSSIVTVAPCNRATHVPAGSLSIPSSSSPSTAFPLTPPSTPPRKKSPKKAQSSPHGTSPSTSTPTKELSRPVTLSPESRSGSNHFQKIGEIGHAGERYAVEFLETHVSGFDRAINWKSKSRTLAGLPNLGENEMTDLEYPDTHGVLSKLLLDRAEEGSVPEWLEATCKPGSKHPTYLLEVKTTEKACETYLFISPHQYEIMKEKAVVGNEVPKEVYVILRVYDLISEPKIRMYIDPWNTRDQKGGLHFDLRKEYHAKPV